MAMAIKVLALEQLTNTTHGLSLYKAASAAPMKTALIKTMRFTGVAASGNVKLNVYFVPSGSTYPTNARLILRAAQRPVMTRSPVTQTSGETADALSHPGTVS